MADRAVRRHGNAVHVREHRHNLLGGRNGLVDDVSAGERDAVGLNGGDHLLDFPQWVDYRNTDREAIEAMRKTEEQLNGDHDE